MEHDHPICRELLDQISDYVDGELEDAVCSELEKHLADCPNCRILVDTVRKTITLYHAQVTRELPPDVEERLLKVLQSEQ